MPPKRNAKGRFVKSKHKKSAKSKQVARKRLLKMLAQMKKNKSPTLFDRFVKAYSRYKRVTPVIHTHRKGNKIIESMSYRL